MLKIIPSASISFEYLGPYKCSHQCLGTLQMTIYITHENDASAASEFVFYNWMLLNSNLTLSLIFFQYLWSLERNQSPDHILCL